MSQVVQSEVVSNFISSKNEFASKSREDEIKEAIIVLKKKAPSMKDSLICGIILALIFDAISLAAFFSKASEKPFFDFLLILASSNLGIVLFSFFVTTVERYEFKSTLKKLKQLLEPTQYETRIQYVSFFSDKLKIVVEGNSDINGLVIKESSKHFTSYLETNNSVELVKNLVKIIEKQEKMFKVKE